MKLTNGNKIDLLRVILTVGIVFRHASMTEEGIMKWIILLTEVCVPLFFALSGYLFFHNLPEKPSAGWFGKKIKSRFFSLFIPYIIANCVAFGLYFFAIKYYPSMVSGFFGDNWKNPFFVFWKGPINLSLWFIRELIVLTILSPLVFIVVKYLRWWGVVLLGVLWAFKIGPSPLFFFSAGACLSIWKIEPVERWLLSTSRTPTETRAWTYFIYLYHYLLVIGIKKALYAWIAPSGTLQLIGVYLFTILSVSVLLTVTYALMRRLLPRLTSIIVGGR